MYFVLYEPVMQRSHIFLFRVVTISACAQSHPASIALRYVQRRVLMSDPNWNKGYYYDGPYPRLGMKHARSVVLLLTTVHVLNSRMLYHKLTSLVSGTPNISLLFYYQGSSHHYVP